MIGRTYLERGRPVVCRARWSSPVQATVLTAVVTRPTAPRNVLIERADGSRAVRPFRGLRRALG